MNRHQTVWGWTLAATAGLLAAGCEEPPIRRGFGSLFAERPSETAADEARYRRRFQEDQDPEAFRWLLAHRIEQGMSPADVGQVLGSAGERVFEDGWLKRNNSRIWRTDETYKWGPDREGHVIYLFFREDGLVNYDPRQYQ